MKTKILVIMATIVFSFSNNAYGCSRDDRLDYVLPWKYEYTDPCISQLQINWIGLLVWIVLGILLFNFALALLGRKTMWMRK